MKIPELLKNKFALTAITVSLIVLILVLVLSPKKTTNSTDPNNISSPQPRTELIDLSKEKRNQAMVYVASIEKKLPIYLEGFKTSVGITTSINIYRLNDDEAEVVRLEIYGLSYLNSESDEKKNPNVTAFKESFLKAVELLEGQNIDPKKLIFIYGDKDYVRETSSTWVEKLKLLP